MRLTGLGLVPLLVVLAAQMALVAVLCVFLVPRVMGRDYDAVVMGVLEPILVLSVMAVIAFLVR